MDRVHDWLQSFVEQGLDAYLNAHATLDPFVDTANCQFTIEDDLSSTSLRSKRRGSLQLIEWCQSEFCTKAVLADSKTSVQAVFTRGAVFQVTDVEIRLTDCFEPSRIELCIEKFELFNYLLDARWRQPEISAIESLPAVQQKLRQYAILRSRNSMANLGDSPSSSASSGIKSQISHGDADGDSENNGDIPISQQEFFTQLPPRSTPAKPTRRSSWRRTSGLNTRDQLMGLLEKDTPKFVTASVTANADVNLKHDEKMSFTPDQRNRNPPAPRDKTPESPDPQVSPRLSSTPHVQPVIAEPERINPLGNDTSYAEEVAPTPALPRAHASHARADDLQQLRPDVLRDWRNQLVAGRYLPRFVKTISKEQDALLDSGDFWQPHLVGRPAMEGCPPLDLLNRLTVAADRAQLSMDDADNVSGANTLELPSPLLASVGATIPVFEAAHSESSEPELEASQWSSSPPRPSKMLPPDSSPPQVPPPRSDVNIPSVETTLTVPQTVKVLPGSAPGSISSLSATKNFVQVDRTPFVTKKPPSDGGALNWGVSEEYASSPRPNSLPPPHSLPQSSRDFVPGTFEIGPDSPHSPAAMLTQDEVDQPEQEFEIESSEDELALEVDERPPVHLEHNSEEQLRASQQVLAEVGQQSGERQPEPKKRKLGTTASTPEVVAKRHKSSVHSSRASDFMVREARHEFFRPHKKRIEASPPAPLDATYPPPTISAGSLPDVSGDPQRTETPYQASTPPTHISLRYQFSVLAASSTSSIVSAPDAGGMAGLFSAYKQAYQDYHGDMVQFSRACDLIRRLRVEKKAPHPSLWDDYIFRLHHDYASYLRDVLESGGSAVSYDDFYTEFVDEPTHRKQVVKPACLNGLPAGSSVKAIGPSSALQLRSPGVADPHVSRSVASTGSVEDIQHIAEFPTARQRASMQSSAILRSQLDVMDQGETNRSHSSTVDAVELWLEKAPGAASPELGTTDSGAEPRDIPQVGLEPVLSESQSEHMEGREMETELVDTAQPDAENSRWWDDSKTPFKMYAKKYTNLGTERAKLGEDIKVDKAGVLRPEVQRIVDIFRWRSRR